MKKKLFLIIVLIFLLCLGGLLSKNISANSTEKSNYEAVEDVEREIESQKSQIEDIFYCIYDKTEKSFI